MSTAGEDVDVLIIGAGISGICAAYRLRERNPDASYAILERRARIGGTWDLFQYPGIRSDSDVFTLSFPFEPWTRDENIADGADIREYLETTARKYGIDRHVRFNARVVAAAWDSTVDRWTVRTMRDGVQTLHRCRYLFCGTGYYDYDQPYTPEFPGAEDFGGQLVHPQFWPKGLDYAGKRVVVIGSGATAISIIPALAKEAALVTMLQRSPGYMMSMPRIDPYVQAIRRVVPRRFAISAVRFWNALLHVLSFVVFRRAPWFGRALVRNRTKARLPAGYPVDVHFKPKYDPWDQRLCLVLDGDLFAHISDGRVDVVTDHVDRFDASGIVLTSGGRIDADVVVTATGLRLHPLGGMIVEVDGRRIDPTDRFMYKEYLLEDVPNMAWCLGYTNASWTLRTDMTAKAFARLVQYMDDRGFTHAYPHRGSAAMTEKPTFDLAAGYIQRSPHALPKSGTKRPWRVRHNYFLDVIERRFDRIDESMVFGRARAVEPSRIPLS